MARLGCALLPGGRVSGENDQYLPFPLVAPMSVWTFWHRLTAHPLVDYVDPLVDADGASRKNDGNHYSEFELKFGAGGRRHVTAAVTAFEEVVAQSVYRARCSIIVSRSQSFCYYCYSYSRWAGGSTRTCGFPPS